MIITSYNLYVLNSDEIKLHNYALVIIQHNFSIKKLYLHVSNIILFNLNGCYPF